MRPQENIVKLIIAKHIEVLAVARLASGIGVYIEILENLNLLDLALDIIGFPQDDMGFKREELKNGELDLDKKDIDGFVDKLYRTFDELMLTNPKLFVKD